MSTTTIRIDSELKARIADVARRTGKTPHAFILEAISQTVERVEHEDELHRIADQRWATLLATGKTIPWDEAKAYLRAKSRGVQGRKPARRRLGR